MSSDPKDTHEVDATWDNKKIRVKGFGSILVICATVVALAALYVLTKG